MWKPYKLLTLITILWTSQLQASVLSYMNALQPAINHTETARLIVKYAAKYHVDPYVIVAIGMAESSLDPNNHRRDRKGISDTGLLQINRGMLKPLHLNPARLLLDPEYYMDEAVKFLAEKIKLGKGDKYPWSLWHDSRPIYRKAYELRVIRYLRLADAHRPHKSINSTLHIPK